MSNRKDERQLGCGCMTTPPTDDDSGELHPSADLGFVGMIVNGADTQAAWQKVRDDLKTRLHRARDHS